MPFIYFPIICAANALKMMLERQPRFAPSIKLFSGILLVAVVLLLEAYPDFLKTAARR